MTPSSDDGPLEAALAEQRHLGILGTSVAEAIAHSERFLLEVTAAETVVDLGSGAGVPGLVLAWRRVDLRVVLLDARQRRTDQLTKLVHRLGLHDRVSVVCGRADVLARSSGLVGSADAVVARSFGSPEAVLVAATPFLRSGGRLVVSEPPGEARRWPSGRLAALDLVRSPTSSPGFFAAVRS
jgi:16S rRNA G527 N7-methylase RsmG